MNFPFLNRLGWMARRLGCMSPAEVGYRVQQMAVARLEQTGICSPVAAGAAMPSPERAGYRPPDAVDAAVYVAEAERILEGLVPLFSASEFPVGFPPRWNTDPLTGIAAPDDFGPSLPITNRAVVGDIKHVWELNRHLHLVRIAQAYALSGDARYAAGLAELLASWLDQCPPLRGPNWSSSLELGIRLLNWSLVWRMLGGWHAQMFSLPGCQNLRERWLASIHAHCAFIRRHLSRYSSANNHLVGELAGLYVAARTWPCWPESHAWGEFAKGELEKELLAQYTREGVNREQATAYHVFATEFLVFAGVCGTLSGDPFSSRYWQSIVSTRDFLNAIRDVAGHTPMFGDADDGIVWCLESRTDNDRAGQLIRLLDALAGTAALERSVTACWLLGGTVPDFPAQFERGDAAGRWRFPDAGYFVFGARFGTRQEVRGVVDCGPLGYLGIAAHGHADALSVLLSVGGEECLVDPGTYSYWQDLKWRDYFRGTSAHNTLRIDGSDQSVSGGRFMWTRKANCNIESLPSSPDRFEFVGTHDGYRRLGDPVVHRRSVKFDGDSRVLEIEDVAKGKGTHLFEQFWHFAPDIEVGLNGGNSAVIAGKKFKIHVTFFGDSLHLDMYRGSEEPVLGWYSAGYETKQACTSLRVSTTAHALQLRAVFSIQQTNAL